MIHLAQHFFVPVIVVALFYRANWQTAITVLMATMLVDLDHLLAVPIYDPNRCSIGFHPLHELWFIVFYLMLCAVPKVRLVGIGLVIHMFLDTIDCQITTGIWYS